ncbi:MAG: hypothetical protein ACE5FD_02930 [Anaerolineae bacterium]
MANEAFAPRLEHNLTGTAGGAAPALCLALPKPKNGRPLPPEGRPFCCWHQFS